MPDAPEPSPDRPERTGRTGRPVVLVVDDTPSVRELIAINLELAGLQVETAEDGQDCLDRVRAIAPDAITIDVVMPRLDGFGAVERLRADPATAHIPVVMVTAAAQSADLSRGDELGVQAYLTKPFDPAELIRVVHGLLGRD